LRKAEAPFAADPSAKRALDAPPRPPPLAAFRSAR